MKDSLNPIIPAFLILLAGGTFLLVKNFEDSATASYTKAVAAVKILPPAPPAVKHLPTPDPLKAVYMSSWTAGSPAGRERIIKMIDETEINAVVIDVKDSTGAVSFKMDDPTVAKVNPFEDRISDIDGLIKELHDKNIYVIARVAVFEDPHLSKVRPDLAVKRKSDGGTWHDRKGLSWTDMGSSEVWDYNIAVAKSAYKIGFDEINFDYVRFPSDGNMEDIEFSSLEGKTVSKPEVLKSFFAYLSASMRKSHVPISADLFGMTTTSKTDMGIGQVLENAMPYFDYIDPMVYPSHYPDNFNGYKNPAAVPYDLIKYVMSSAVERMVAASSTPAKLRPWLQDFNLGAIYTAPMVRDQIKATYDVGLNSWLLWSAANRYTEAALEKN